MYSEKLASGKKLAPGEKLSYSEKLVYSSVVELLPRIPQGLRTRLGHCPRILQ